MRFAPKKGGGTVTLPKSIVPMANGRKMPTEHPAYLTPMEMHMLRRLTDGKSNKTKFGPQSFVDPSGAYGGDMSGTQNGTNNNGSGTPAGGDGGGAGWGGPTAGGLGSSPSGAGTGGMGGGGGSPSGGGGYYGGGAPSVGAHTTGNGGGYGVGNGGGSLSGSKQDSGGYNPGSSNSSVSGFMAGLGIGSDPQATAAFAKGLQQAAASFGFTGLTTNGMPANMAPMKDQSRIGTADSMTAPAYANAVMADNYSQYRSPPGQSYASASSVPGIPTPQSNVNAVASQYMGHNLGAPQIGQPQAPQASNGSYFGDIGSAQIAQAQTPGNQYPGMSSQGAPGFNEQSNLSDAFKEAHPNFATNLRSAFDNFALNQTPGSYSYPGGDGITSADQGGVFSPPTATASAQMPNAPIDYNHPVAPIGPAKPKNFIGQAFWNGVNHLRNSPSAPSTPAPNDGGYGPAMFDGLDPTGMFGGGGAPGPGGLFDHGSKDYQQSPNDPFSNPSKDLTSDQVASLKTEYKTASQARRKEILDILSGKKPYPPKVTDPGPGTGGLLNPQYPTYTQYWAGLPKGSIL